MHYTLQTNIKTQILKKFSAGKISDTKKMLSFSFHELQLIKVSFFICGSYVNRGTRFAFACVFFPFSIPFRIYYILYF